MFRRQARRALLLFSQLANVGDESLDLVVRQLVLVGGHFVFAIGHDGDELLIGLILHIRRSEIVGAQRFGHGSARFAIWTMACGTLGLVKAGGIVLSAQGSDEQNKGSEGSESVSKAANRQANHLLPPS